MDATVLVMDVIEGLRTTDGGILDFTGSVIDKALQTHTLSLLMKLTTGKLHHFSMVMFYQQVWNAHR